MFDDDEELQRTKDNLNQAVGSVRNLANQRDLYQIALQQWVAGQFKLIDSLTDRGVNHELYLFLDRGSRDIVIELVRLDAQSCAMKVSWADSVVDIAARAVRNTDCVRWAGIITEHRDKRERK